MRNINSLALKYRIKELEEKAKQKQNEISKQLALTK